MHNQPTGGQIRPWGLVALVMGLCLSGLAAGQQNESTPEDKIYVGILDDAREEMRNWKPGVAEHRIIMPAFEKNESGWQSIKSFTPLQLKWTIAFDGRNLGQVESRTATEGDRLSSESSRAKQEILTPRLRFHLLAILLPGSRVCSQLGRKNSVGPS
jgi:hypothetical protein